MDGEVAVRADGDAIYIGVTASLNLGDNPMHMQAGFAGLPFLATPPTGVAISFPDPFLQLQYRLPLVRTGVIFSRSNVVGSHGLLAPFRFLISIEISLLT